MTFTLDGNLFLVILLVPLLLLVVVAAMPRWLFRSWGKHSLWTLRDKVVDEVIVGDLPAQDDAVRELIARLEWAIQEAKSFDLMHVLVWERARRKIPPAALKKFSGVPSCDSLTKDQAERIRLYRRHYDSVAIRTIFTSSWAGWVIVGWVATPVVFRAAWSRLSKRGLTNLNPVGLGWYINDRLAVATWLGRWAADFVDTKGPGAMAPVPALA
jgi:hypothetical protein